MQLQAQSLHITPKTKIARNHVENTDNQGLMMQALNAMGYNEYTIQIGN